LKEKRGEGKYCRGAVWEAFGKKKAIKESNNVLVMGGRKDLSIDHNNGRVGGKGRLGGVCSTKSGRKKIH